jgi:DNA-binding NarL/FixJ family response regulator
MDRTVHVVVLYAHPLLGEGLASLLSSEPGVSAVAIARDDPTVTTEVIAGQADLVVVEETDAQSPSDTDAGSSPTAVFVIVQAAGGGWIRRRLSDPDAVLEVARALRRRRPREEALRTSVTSAAH